MGQGVVVFNGQVREPETTKTLLNKDLKAKKRLLGIPGEKALQGGKRAKSKSLKVGAFLTHEK